MNNIGKKLLFLFIGAIIFIFQGASLLLIFSNKTIDNDASDVNTQTQEENSDLANERATVGTTAFLANYSFIDNGYSTQDTAVAALGTSTTANTTFDDIIETNSDFVDFTYVNLDTGESTTITDQKITSTDTYGNHGDYYSNDGTWPAYLTIEMSGLEPGTDYEITDWDQSQDMTTQGDWEFQNGPMPFWTDYELEATGNEIATITKDDEANSTITGFNFIGTFEDYEITDAEIASGNAYNNLQNQLDVEIELNDDPANTVSGEIIDEDTISFDATGMSPADNVKITGIYYNYDETTNSGDVGTSGSHDTDPYYLDADIDIDYGGWTINMLTDSDPYDIQQTTASVDLTSNFSYAALGGSTTFDVDFTNGETHVGTLEESGELKITGLTPGTDYEIESITNQDSEIDSPNVDVTGYTTTFTTDYILADTGASVVVDGDTSLVTISGLYSSANVDPTQYSEDQLQREAEFIFSNGQSVSLDLSDDGSYSFDYTSVNPIEGGAWAYEEGMTLNEVDYNYYFDGTGSTRTDAYVLDGLSIPVELINFSLQTSVSGEVENVMQTTADVPLNFDNYEFSDLEDESAAGTFEVNLTDGSGASVTANSVVTATGDTSESGTLEITGLTPDTDYTIDSITNPADDIDDVDLGSYGLDFTTDYKLDASSATANLDAQTDQVTVSGIDYLDSDLSTLTEDELTVELTVNGVSIASDIDPLTGNITFDNPGSIEDGDQITSIDYYYQSGSDNYKYTDTNPITINVINNQSMIYSSDVYGVNQTEATIDITLQNFTAGDLETAGADTEFVIELTEDGVDKTLTSEDITYSNSGDATSTTISLTMSNLNPGTEYVITEISNTDPLIANPIVTNPNTNDLTFTTDYTLDFSSVASVEIDALNATGTLEGVVVGGSLSTFTSSETSVRLTFDNGQSVITEANEDGTMSFKTDGTNSTGGTELDYDAITLLTTVEYNYEADDSAYATPSYSITDLAIPVNITYDATTSLDSTVTNITQTTADLTLNFNGYTYGDLTDIATITGEPADVFDVTLDDGTTQSLTLEAADDTATTGTLSLTGLTAGTNYEVTSITNDNTEVQDVTIPETTSFITDYKLDATGAGVTADLDLITETGTVSGLDYSGVDLTSYTTEQLEVTLTFTQTTDGSNIDIASEIDSATGDISFDTSATSWDYTEEYTLTSIAYNNDGTTPTGEPYTTLASAVVAANADTTTTIFDIDSINQTDARIILSLNGYDYTYLVDNGATVFDISLSSSEGTKDIADVTAQENESNANQVYLNISGLTAGTTYTVDSITNQNNSAVKPVDTSSNNVFTTDYEIQDNGDTEANISSLNNTGSISGLDYGVATYSSYPEIGQRDVVLTFTGEDTSLVTIDSVINVDGTIDFDPTTTTSGTWDYSQTYYLTNITYNNALYSLDLNVEVVSTSDTESSVLRIENETKKSADIVIGLDNYTYQHLIDTDAEEFNVTLTDSEGTDLDTQTVTSVQGTVENEAILSVTGLNSGEEYTIKSITNSKPNEVTDVVIDDQTPSIITDYNMVGDGETITTSVNPLSNTGKVEGITYENAIYGNYDETERGVVLTFTSEDDSVTNINSVINSDGTIDFDITAGDNTWDESKTYYLTNISYNEQQYDLELDDADIEVEYSSTTTTSISEITNVTQTTADIVLKLEDYNYSDLTDTTSEEFTVILKDSGDTETTQTVTSTDSSTTDEQQATLTVENLVAGETYTIVSIENTNTEVYDPVNVEESAIKTFTTDYSIVSSENAEVTIDSLTEEGTVTGLTYQGDFADYTSDQLEVTLTFTADDSSTTTIDSSIESNGDISFAIADAETPWDFDQEYSLTAIEYNNDGSTGMVDNAQYTFDIDPGIKVEFNSDSTETTVARIESVTQDSASIILSTNYDYDTLVDVVAVDYTVTLDNVDAGEQEVQTVTVGSSTVIDADNDEYEISLDLIGLTSGTNYKIASIKNDKPDLIADVVLAGDANEAFLTDYEITDDESAVVTVNQLNDEGTITDLGYTGELTQYSGNELSVELSFEDKDSTNTIIVDANIDSEDGSITFDATDFDDSDTSENSAWTLTNISYNKKEDVDGNLDHTYDFTTNISVTFDNSDSEKATLSNSVTNITQTSATLTATLDSDNFDYTYLETNNAEDFDIEYLDEDTLDTETVTIASEKVEEQVISFDITDLTAGHTYEITKVTNVELEFVLNQQGTTTFETDYKLSTTPATEGKETTTGTQININSNSDVGTISNIKIDGDIDNKNNSTTTTNTYLIFTDGTDAESADLLIVDNMDNNDAIKYIYNNENQTYSIVFDASALKEETGTYSSDLVLRGIVYDQGDGSTDQQITIGGTNIEINGYAISTDSLTTEQKTVTITGHGFWWWLLVLLIILIIISLIYMYFNNRRYRITRKHFKKLASDTSLRIDVKKLEI